MIRVFAGDDVRYYPMTVAVVTRPSSRASNANSAADCGAPVVETISETQRSRCDRAVRRNASSASRRTVHDDGHCVLLLVARAMVDGVIRSSNTRFRRRPSYYPPALEGGKTRTRSTGRWLALRSATAGPSHVVRQANFQVASPSVTDTVIRPSPSYVLATLNHNRLRLVRKRVFDRANPRGNTSTAPSRAEITALHRTPFKVIAARFQLGGPVNYLLMRITDIAGWIGSHEGDVWVEPWRCARHIYANRLNPVLLSPPVERDAGYWGRW